MADPSTIQFDTGSVGGGSLGASGAAPRAGIQGGQIRGSGSPTTGAGWFESVGGMSSGVDNSIPDFINEAVAPALEVTKQRRMWEGFVAARAGKTLDEIADDQPWYSKFFGPTNFEIGATTFAAQKQSAEMENELVANMPLLRQKTPEEMAGVLNDMSMSRMTGNPYADMILQKTFMQRAATVMDLHTKERVAWQNTEQSKAQLEARSAAAQAVHNTLTRVAELGDGNGPDQLAAAEQAATAKAVFLDVIGTVPPNQTDESLWANTRAIYREAVRNGWGKAINILDDAGLRDALPLAQREELDAMVEQQESYYKAHLPVDDPIVRQRVQWEADAQRGYTSPEQTVLGALAINQRFSVRTGFRQPLLDVGDVMGGAQSSLNAIYSQREAEARALAAAAEKATTEAEKLQVKETKLKMDRTTLVQGSFGRAINEGMATATDFNQAIMAEMEADPKSALTAAVRQFAFPMYSAKSEALKTALQQNVPVSPDADYTPTIDTALAQLQFMRDADIPVKAGGARDTTSGQAAVLEYFGQERTQLLMAYGQQRDAGLHPPAAWKAAQQRVSTGPTGRGVTSREQYATLQARANDIGAGLISRVFDKREKFVHQGYLVQSAVELWPEIDKTYPSMSDSDKADAAIRLAQVRNTDVAGQFSWRRKEGMRPITSYANVNADRFSATLSQYIREKAKKANVDTDTAENQMIVQRLPDMDGAPVLTVWARDKDGKQVSLLFGQREFDEVNKRAADRKITATQLRHTPSTPRLTF